MYFYRVCFSYFAFKQASFITFNRIIPDFDTRNYQKGSFGVCCFKMILFALPHLAIFFIFPRLTVCKY